MPLPAWSGSPPTPDHIGNGRSPDPQATPPASNDSVYTAAVYTPELYEEAPPSVPPSVPPQPPASTPPRAPAPAAHMPAPPHHPASQTAAQQESPAEEGEAETEEGGFYLRQSVMHGLAAAGSSTVINLVLLIVLGLMSSGSLPRPEVKIIEASVEEERPVDEVVQRLTKDLKPSTELNPTSSVSTAGAGIAGVTTITTVAPPKLNTTVVDRPTAMRVDVGVANSFTTTGQSFVAAVPQGTLGEALTTAQGYGEAMDILTQEILNRLARGKVLVVWVFDQSLSMKDDQKEIRERLEKVYAELGLSTVTKGDALSTAVVSFGKDFAVHTQRPTNIMEDIRKAIDAVPVDESGEEMTCMAIGKSVAGFRQFAAAGGGRQMMVVVVSDEKRKSARQHQFDRAVHQRLQGSQGFGVCARSRSRVRLSLRTHELVGDAPHGKRRHHLAEFRRPGRTRARNSVRRDAANRRL